MGLTFPWETKPSGSGVSTPVAEQGLDVHNNQFTANGAYVLAFPAARKRKWLVIQNWKDSAGVALVSPTQGPPGSSDYKWGYIYLYPGDSVIFSESGDMPWTGSVYVSSTGGAVQIAATEAQEFPIE